MSSLLRFYIYIDICLYVKCFSVYNYVYCIVLNIYIWDIVCNEDKFLPSITLFLIIIYYIYYYYLHKVVIKICDLLVNRCRVSWNVLVCRADVILASKCSVFF